jgi:NAD(P)-dependent dehydrogenase (short-subunit alcohol dehydrogenase family)
VVTGGGSGIGRAVGEALAREGRSVAVLDLDGDAAVAAANDMRAEGAAVMHASVDVADRSSVDRAFDAVRGNLGPIEILVTSAAISGFVRFADISLGDWSRTLAVNLTGTFNCVQAALPDMVVSGWGRVVTVSSAAGQTGSPRQAHYSASKGGVIALTKTVALEFASKGITANTVPPFAVDTAMLRDAQQSRHLPDSKVLEQMVPARRLGTAADIAAVCTFLCSEEAGYLTGQVVGVNGGAVT